MSEKPAVETKRIPPHEGSIPKLFKKRKYVKHKTLMTRPIMLNNIERFSIQLDHQMGEPQVNLMKRWGLSYTGLKQVLGEKIDVTDGMQAYLRKLSFNLMQTMEKINGSIDDSIISKASLPQRMVSLGIGIDKAVNISKHLDGTKDPRAPVINFGDRQALEEAVKRRLDDLPVMELVEEAQVEVVEEGEAEPEDEQLEMFAGKDFEFQDTEEKNGKMYRVDPRDEEAEDDEEISP